MERMILTNCLVLFVVVLFFGVVLSLPQYDSQLSEKRDDKNVGKKPAYFWFGPRLGRKKRNPNSDEAYRSSDYEREQLATLMDVIQDSPWAIVAVNEGKRHTVSFTPRLGRESGEDFMNNGPGDRWLQEPEVTGELLSQRSPPFAPRLGRRLSPYSPRLGRENEKNQL